ncbi:MAG TPA: hypothetical protein VM262_12450 [Acidimicrobiales bacterium]|nr:hypothetical protein [Acidimicrobiales bacterium]
MTTKVIETAAPGDLDDLRIEILRRIAPLVRAAGLAEHEVDCRLEGPAARLTVVLRGPRLAAAVRQALGVRVLDAVHADGRTFGTVDVVGQFGTDAVVAGEPPTG